MRLVFASSLALALTACSDSTEAPTVRLPVVTEGGAFAPATTDLGYTVVTHRIRLAIANLELTIEGEMHAKPGPVPHPGHYAGGDVTGTMPGNFLLDWDGTEHAVGTAELIVGDYQGANLTFRAAGAADGLAAGDAMLGHVFHIEGVASKDGVDRPFDALVDLEPDTALVGAVFEDVVTEASTEALRVSILPIDPVEQDTIYDGLDFATLPVEDGVIAIRPGSAVHNAFRRPLQTHDHYAIHH